MHTRVLDVVLRCVRDAIAAAGADATIVTSWHGEER